MIQVHFFANLRETLNCDAAALTWREDLRQVRDVVAELADTHGETWRQILLAEKVLVAVNQEVSSLDAAVADGDEVAFFPPVTGG